MRNESFLIILRFLAIELNISPLKIDKKLKIIKPLARIADGNLGTKPVSINSMITGKPISNPSMENRPPIVPKTNLGW